MLQDRLVALARLLFQSPTVENGKVAVLVLDHASLLQSIGNQRETRPLHAEQRCKKFVSEIKLIREGVVVRKEKPATKALVQGMHTIAGRRLGDLIGEQKQVFIDTSCNW